MQGGKNGTGDSEYEQLFEDFKSKKKHIFGILFLQTIQQNIPYDMTTSREYGRQPDILPLLKPFNNNLDFTNEENYNKYVDKLIKLYRKYRFSVNPFSDIKRQLKNYLHLIYNISYDKLRRLGLSINAKPETVAVRRDPAIRAPAAPAAPIAGGKNFK